MRVPAAGKARTCALQELALTQELHHPCIVATQVCATTPFGPSSRPTSSLRDEVAPRARRERKAPAPARDDTHVHVIDSGAASRCSAGGAPRVGQPWLGVWTRPPALYSPWRELLGVEDACVAREAMRGELVVSAREEGGQKRRRRRAWTATRTRRTSCRSTARAAR